MPGFNRGDEYENVIYEICKKRGILPPGFSRAGASAEGADIIFIYNGKENVLEVKVDLQADYGQKYLSWDENGWDWSKPDKTTDLYSSLGALDYVNKHNNFSPRRHTVDKEKIVLNDKKWDQNMFEKKFDVPIESLYRYYELKNCYYIQVGGFGFYYLRKDVLNLSMPQFDGEVCLRFRAKTIHSFPVHNYGFLGVLKIKTKPTESTHDIEELNGRKFPPIIP